MFLYFWGNIFFEGDPATWAAHSSKLHVWRGGRSERVLLSNGNLVWRHASALPSLWGSHLDAFGRKEKIKVKGYWKHRGSRDLEKDIHGLFFQTVCCFWHDSHTPLRPQTVYFDYNWPWSSLRQLQQWFLIVVSTSSTGTLFSVELVSMCAMSSQ